MTASKHIAMWFCPRSRSTAIARAFEQLDECIVYDEPFYGAYLAIKGQDNYPPIQPEELSKYHDTDYNAIIKKITGELPHGTSFSFQKQQSKHLLKEFGKNWITELNNFFLIRNPKQQIFSYWKANQFSTKFKVEHTGWVQHYNLFCHIKNITGETPLVIDADDLAKFPQKYLKLICKNFNIRFSEKMLTWEVNPSPSKTKMTWTKGTSYYHWYSDVLNSSKFVYNKKEETDIDLPKELTPILEFCMPLYEKLFAQRIVADQ